MAKVTMYNPEGASTLVSQKVANRLRDEGWSEDPPKPKPKQVNKNARSRHRKTVPDTG